MKSLKILFIFVFLVLILLVFTIVKTCWHTKTISIATGSENGAYYQYALKYKELLAEEGITLDVHSTDGSIAAQKMLLNNEVDFAFVQGGTEKKSILALANVAYEPIWIFYKDERFSSLRMLEDKRVAIGRKQSGIYPISKELLTTVYVDINRSNFKMISSKRAVQKLERGQLDAMFYVGSEKASIVKDLMGIKNIHLMDFDKAEAYQQYSLSKNIYYECLTLKKSGFDYERGLPQQSHMLLAKTTLVATRSDLSDDMVRLLLKVMNKVHRNAGMFHTENTFPNVSKLKIEQHAASIAYFQKRETFLEKHVPFWLAQTLQGQYTFALFFFLPLIALFAFVVEVIIPAYAHYSRQKINKWYYIVNEIDTGMDKLTSSEIKEKIDFLNNLLIEVRETDDIPAIHMGPFYTLQNQIVHIISDLQRRVNH
ncbi:MAG TPA: hypothetical protein EYG83_00110 [Sulfurospirillum arcachonense]|nr:hypothetical protein [Sulfurospirillum arcachonense]